jgi:hypothetical protein
MKKIIKFSQIKKIHFYFLNIIFNNKNLKNILNKLLKIK